jgi:hypothetical protein
MLSSAACDSLWMSDAVSKCRPFSFIFNLGNKAKSQRAKSGEYGGWGTITMLLLVTNSLFSGTCGRKRCPDEGVSCGRAKVTVFFVAHFLSNVSKGHSISKVRVYRSVRRNRYAVNKSIHVEKNNEHVIC